MIKTTTIDDLAIMIAKGFSAVDARFDRLEARMDRFDIKVDDLESSHERRLSILENKVFSLNSH